MCLEVGRGLGGSWVNPRGIWGNYKTRACGEFEGVRENSEWGQDGGIWEGGVGSSNDSR